MKRDIDFWVGMFAFVVAFPFSLNVYTLFISVIAYAVGVLCIINSKKGNLNKLSFSVLPVIGWVMLVKFNIIDLAGI